MGWGFRKRAGLFGGLLRLNVSKQGLGASVGAPGLRVGLNSLNGAYLRGGVPGSGISFSESLKHHKKPEKKQVGFLAILACALFVVIWVLTVYVNAIHPVR
jgi:hypothetical protein